MIKHMRSQCLVSFALISILGPPLARAADGPETNPSPEAPKTIALALQPAKPPVPALKYRLLTPYLNQSPGNAAPIYHMAAELRAQQGRPQDIEQVSKWLDQPADQLPRPEAREMLDQNAAVLREVHVAANREYCRWELPLRTEAIQTLLPFLSEYRSLAKLVALEARVASLEGRFDDAARSLQTGFTMAAHLADEPVLITSLVGAAVGSIMTREVEVFVARPGAPNLYWALANLPRPFLDLRRPLEGEEAMVYLEIPELAHIEEVMTPEKAAGINALLSQIANSSGARREQDWSEKLGAAVRAAGQYSEAKRRLIEAGRKQAVIEAMPVQQVVLLDALTWYAERRDETFKWLALPYWQAKPHLHDLERQLEQDIKSKRGMPFMMLMPSLQRACFNLRMLDRRIEALTCVEAIRLYAAEHDGKLPDSLEAITAVPTPMDPITGKPFVFKLGDGTVILSVLAPEGERTGAGFEYVITIRK